MLRKKDLIFVIIVVILAIFFLITLFWSLFLDPKSSLRDVLFFIGMNLITPIFLVSLIGYLRDVKFMRFTRNKNEERKRFKDLTKNQKKFAILTIIGLTTMVAASSNAEYLRMNLGSHIVTDFFTVLTYVGLGLGLIGIIPLMRSSSESSKE